jgi:DNA invertase Pin-like site-specific DNA recombinase
MTTYGYARTSTVEQVAGLADQVAKLKEAGCTDQSIYQEQISSVKMADRVEFAARSMIHMIEIEAAVAAVGASMRILDMAVDTSTPQGRLTFNLFSSIAQFERENMLERQKVGIAAAKAEGKYTGRAPTAQKKTAQVLAMHAKGNTKQEIAGACGIGIASVYRILRAAA